MFLEIDLMGVKRLITHICLIAGIAVLPAGSVSAGVVAAEYFAAGGPGFGVGDDQFQAAQTFVSNATGVVEEVQLLIGLRGAPDPVSITVSITDTAAGLPNNTLGSVTVLNPVIGDVESYVAIDFTSESIALVSGNSYAWTLSSPDSVGIEGDAPGGYTDGAAFRSGDGGATWNLIGGPNDEPVDWGFQVTGVPEPGSLALLGLSVLMVSQRRHNSMH